MTNTLDLYNFFGVTPQEEKTTVVISQASPGQIKYYNDLCIQKNVPADSAHESWDSAKISTEIKRLLAMKNVWPASPNQINTIKEICSRNKLEVPPNLDKLTGGKEGTASQLIQKLIQFERDNVSAFASDSQIELLSNMVICPDCESQDMWKDKKITKEEASEYINKNKAAYFAWKATRLSPAQAERIIQLQGRLSCCDGCTNYKSEIIEGKKETCLSSCDVLKEAKEKGAVFNNIQLIQFSKKLAGSYIDQLTKELADKELKRSTISHKLDDDKLCRSISKGEVIKLQRKQINTCIYKMYASIGQEVEDEIINQFSLSKFIDLIQFVSFYQPVEVIVEMCDNLLTEMEIYGIIGNEEEVIKTIIEEREIALTA